MVVKVVVDNVAIDISKENYELFCDVKTFLLHVAFHSSPKSFVIFA